MKIIPHSKSLELFPFMELAGEVAKQATCKRSKCGSIIVKNGKVIGSGFNSPPGNLESERRCTCDKKTLDFKVTDKTCCIHAEQRAIMDALKNHPNEIEYSRLYFARLSESGEIEFSGEPYCTICSKMALDTGIKEFVLYRKEGICIYDTEEYNSFSFAYKNHI
ncbi:MAG: hypothetical protein ACD_78C00441G0006 [uncultured bacterium (gcode 4)]|uniref:CMP/dCMP-type deaminase domain-containing protein n=1 Tax=uncultured bacterium (gcode 4) TaxID=1234023 RepID=K1YVN9_9BACT|nr:MAG: hypothetical protein ACD_78C00441G0006 [uncultured bacterium (gcode 4)]HBB27440.1 hypothetical protein [Candidatus Gracilibacteria bacterium]